MRLEPWKIDIDQNTFQTDQIKRKKTLEETPFTPK